MTLQVLFSAGAELWPEFRPALEASFTATGLDVNLFDQADAPGAVDYMIYAPTTDADDLSPFVNVRLIQSLWAGPDKLIANPTLTQPLARMVDAGLTQGMIDYVLGHVLRHHLGTDRFAAAKPTQWLQKFTPPLPRDRVVAFLGVGDLGMACAKAVQRHGFWVLGWSRSLKADAEVLCYAGDTGLRKVLGQADIVVLLLPHTPATENMINARTMAMMKDGASIINPARGHLIVDDDLLAALDSGKISQATLDVFRVEPLPPEHRYWAHPNVLVTPHVAAETRIETAAQVAAENIRRCEAGEEVLFLVDRGVGY